MALLVIRGNAADPHEVDLVRERIAGPELTSKMADPMTGYIHDGILHPLAGPVEASRRRARENRRHRLVIDLRGATKGDIDDGVGAARLFVKSGTLTIRETKGNPKDVVAAQPGDGAITAPVVLLVDQSTARAGEVFAAALDGNKRAEMIGEHTLGSAAKQRLVSCRTAARCSSPICATSRLEAR